MRHISLRLIAAILGATVSLISVGPARGKSNDEIIAFIRNAEDITLYSINPETDEWRRSLGLKPNKPSPLFFVYPILGVVEGKSEALKEKLRKAALETVTPPLAGFSTKMMCFEPRHALKFKSGNQVLELIICYECRSFIFGFNGRFLDENEDGINFKSPAQADLNSILDELKVPRDIPKRKVEK